MIKDMIRSLLIIALSLVVGTIAGKLLQNILEKYQVNNYSNITYKSMMENLQYNNNDDDNDNDNKKWKIRNYK